MEAEKSDTDSIFGKDSNESESISNSPSDSDSLEDRSQSQYSSPESIQTDSMETDSKLLNYLANKQMDVKAIDFPDSLSGVLDLSVLEKNGYDSIEVIKLPPGHITSIVHIPTSVHKLICSHNLLTSISIPPTLLELEVEYNEISSVESEPNSMLEKLNISGNRLDEDSFEYSHFPNLISWKLNDNNFQILDLDAFHQLDVLECIGNDDIKLENVQENTKIIMDKPVQDIRMDDDMSIAENYEDVIMQYFLKLNKYKKQVESQIEKYKKKLRKEKVPASEIPMKIQEYRNTQLKCIQCSKKGQGTIFKQEKGIYTATCGALKKPCNFNIHIKNKASDKSALDEFNESFEKKEVFSQKLLQSKCDAIYGLLGEADITKEFEENLLQYTQFADANKMSKIRYQEETPNIQDIHRLKKDLYHAIQILKDLMKDYDISTDHEKQELLEAAMENQEKVSEIARTIQRICVW